MSVIGIRWYRPDPASLSSLLVSRILTVRVGRMEWVMYWHARGRW